MKNLFLLFFCILAMKLTSQNVGIGTITPAFPLHVVKNSPNVEIARLQSNGGLGFMRVGNGSAFSYFGHTGEQGFIGTQSPEDFGILTGSMYRLYIKNGTGNIGIGTTNPLSPLDVVTNNADIDLARFTGNGGYGQILVSNSNLTSELGANDDYGYVGSNSDDDFVIRSSGVARMCVKAYGDIGIGTNAPEALLDVQSPFPYADIARFASNGGYGQILVSNGTVSTDLGADESKGYAGTNSDHDFNLRAGGDDVMTLKNGSQFVGIGTTTPECKLNVVTDQPNSDVAIFKNTTGNSSALITNGSQTLGLAAYPSLCVAGSFTPTDFSLQTFGQNRMYISNATGNIGMGTSSPGFPLHVHSNNQDLSLAKFDCVGGYGQIAVSNGTVGTSFGVNNSKGYIGTTSNTDFGIYTGANELIHLRQEYGYVGVGTNMPLSKFHVETNDPYNSIATFKNISGYSSLSVTNNTQYLEIGVTPQQAFIATYNNTDFAIKTLGVNRIFIDKTNGYVGMGTNVPTTTLHVLSPTTLDQVARFEPGGGINGYIKVGTNNNSVDLGSDFSKSYISTSGSQDFVISTSGTERIHIKNSTGSVGIGTNNPSAKLTVLGSTNLQGSLVTTGEVSLLTNCTINENLTVGYIVQPDRIPVTWYNNNFFHNLGAPYEDVTYYKDKENRVHLSGIVETTNSQTGTMFILPTGYRPMGNQVFAQMTNSGNVIRINVLSTGNVTIQGTLNGWVTMDAISFRAQ